MTSWMLLVVVVAVQVHVDFDYQSDVVKLHQLVDFKEEVVGWYDALLYLLRHCVIYRPLIVVVDVAFELFVLCVVMC